MTARKSSSLIFTIRASLVMPALLTRTSTPPASRTIRARSSGLVTSATRMPSPGLRSTRSTSWPSRASRSATAWPIPRAAPVTIALIGAPCAPAPVRADLGLEIASRISYLDLAHVLGVYADQLAADAAAGLQLRDPVLEILGVGVRADGDGVGVVTLGGE